MVAPFWAGADTSLYNEPAVFYRETTDPSLILEVKNYIDGLYGVSFTPSGLFIATWDNIGYQNKHTDKVCHTPKVPLSSCICREGGNVFPSLS